MVKKDEGDAPKPAEPPAVADSWKRIEAWLDAHLPPYKKTLKPGISDKDLVKFEKAIGTALPEDVRQSWRIHDGQRVLSDDVLEALLEEDEDTEPQDFIGIIFGDALLNLVARKCPATGDSALGQWQSWAEIADEDYSDVDQWQTSSPAGAIKRCYANRGWIPLGALTDCDFFGVDLDPGPNGVIGQIINFGRNEEKKYVLATSWAQFLSDVADELEAGNFTIDLRQEHEEFRMVRPRRGTLRSNVKEWSAAKLAGKLLE